MEDPYDRTPYDSDPCPTSHPDRLAVIARLFGLRPHDVTTCSVLELGCGTGANLIPMAAALPRSRFVGIDLSAVQVATGRADLTALGLTNLTLHAGDLTDLPADLGRFDFVLAHGVFSWVTPSVQDALLSAARACLEDDGVAYVSYTALPGGNARLALRDLLVFGAREESLPLMRVAAARDFAAVVAVQLSADAPNAAAIQRLIVELGGMSDAYVLHDYLSAVHEAFTLGAFVERAAAHHLQYLGDAQLHTMFPTENDSVGRSFHTSLLCRDERVLDRQLTWQSLEPLRLTTRAKPRGREGPAWTFRFADRAVFGTSSALVAAALDHLADEHPRSVPFDALCDHARASLDGSSATRDDRELLGHALLIAGSADRIELSTCDLGMAPGASHRPTALASARLQATRGGAVTNLLHRTVLLGAGQRALLILLDGNHTRAELLLALGVPSDPEVLEAQLSALVDAALLVD